MLAPAYLILTPRLRLVPASPEHASAVKEATDLSLPELQSWMTWSSELPLPIEHHVGTLRGFRAQFERDEVYGYLGFDRADEAFAGGSGLHRRVGPDALEVGYWIRSDRTGRGYATELAAALTRVGFEVHGVARMELRVAAGNVRSSAVARKLGYQLEATLRARIPLPGDRLGDAEVWTMFRADYPTSAASQVEIAAHDAVGRRMI